MNSQISEAKQITSNNEKNLENYSKNVKAKANAIFYMS